MFRSLPAAVLLSLAAGAADAQQLPTLSGRPAASAVAALPPAGVGPAGAAEYARTPDPAPLKIGGGGVRLGDAGGTDPEPRGTSAWGVAGALALVLGLFAAAAKWFGGSRLTAAAAGGGTCEVLARVKLEPRASMHVVRIGGRVILVGSAADGLTALGEIDDPVEAEALAAACRVQAPRTLRRAGVGRDAGRESFRTLFGRAAARVASGPEPSTVEPREPDVSDAERRLAARLRPAGATR
ncbi:FliO/MopB family protein [Alienimonas californiensis]|uniref:Flagellar biosynthesis protein, FliO n=1 Tax=Alienimonas californiensis TaxID=2527989 RepID=A0A517PE29_9PLAN|nr:flagellar biosynthetic protein FliO [Alienimonas californiensis]QDT17628.1 Flagellar biosynthesis protein, FliO [Alienimonas californiensis]